MKSLGPGLLFRDIYINVTSRDHEIHLSYERTLGLFRGSFLGG